MYNIIFYYKYRQQENKGRDNGRFQGSILVFFASLVHVVFIASILRKYVWSNTDLKFLSGDKLIQSFLFVICIVVIYLYYTPLRIKKLENKYLGNDWFESYGGIISACLIFIPLVLIIIVLSV